MKNSEIFKALIIAPLLAAPISIKVWMFLLPHVNLAIIQWLHILQASRSRRNIFPKTQAFEMGWQRLLSATDWMDWFVLAGIFLMVMNIFFWFFTWLGKKALKEQ